MKKIKHLFLFAICFGFLLQVNSAPVDRAIAKKVAMTYCKHKTAFLQNLNASSVISEHTLFFAGKATMYVFNLEQGFVITTADDRAPAIIAYSSEGQLDVNNIPAPAKMWLTPIQEYVANLQIENPKAATHSQWIELQNDNITSNVSAVKGVNPIVTSNWGQAQGYNDSCPEIANGPGGRSLTGCVATSMAQIMYYHKYPQFGNGSNSYTHIYFGTISEDFSSAEYLWNNMSNTANSTTRANISKLMYHAGVSVNMNYGPDGSGTQSQFAASALQNNFRYRPDIRSISRLDYTLLNWQRIMKDNLDAHQPILYSGTDDESTNAGGHAWVCDGYNDNNYFHMNWGWDGAGNGYFWLDTLKVMIGTVSQGSFKASQNAVVNIAPIGQKFCYETRVFNEPNFTFNDGSNLSPYKNNTDCRSIIDLDSMAINLTFTYFDTQASNDILKVYHGTIENPDSLIGTYSGNTPPAPIVTPQGGKLYLVFTSDDSVQGEGWTASVQGTWQGINETATTSNNVRLYPNPATDNLLVTIPELTNANSTVSFIDLTGRVISKSNVQFSSAGNVFVNTSALTAGIYIIKIESNNHITFSSKLIKK